MILFDEKDLKNILETMESFSKMKSKDSIKKVLYTLIDIGFTLSENWIIMGIEAIIQKMELEKASKEKLDMAKHLLNVIYGVTLNRRSNDSDMEKFIKKSFVFKDSTQETN